MKLYAAFYGNWHEGERRYKWQPLEKAVEQCGIELPVTHRAQGDARLARALLYHIAYGDSRAMPTYVRRKKKGFWQVLVEGIRGWR